MATNGKTLRREVMTKALEAPSDWFHAPKKSSGLSNTPTVPQTNTGRWGEYPKALERTLVKELGKLAP